MNTPGYIREEIEKKLKWLAETQIQESKEHRTRFEEMLWHVIALKLKSATQLCKTLEALHQKEAKKECIYCSEKTEENSIICKREECMSMLDQDTWDLEDER